MFARSAWLAVLISIVAMVAGCSNSADWSDKEVSNAVSVWVNQLGLNQTDENVWSDRLDDVCAAGADYPSLSEQYIAEDAEYSGRSDGSMPPVGEADASLEIIQLQTCDRRTG